MANVEIVATIELYKFNRTKLGKKPDPSRSSSQARLDIEIMDPFWGVMLLPRDGFCAHSL